eukprot:6490600-Amphidinium_carterae.1
MLRIPLCVVARDRQYVKRDGQKLRCPVQWNYCPFTVSALQLNRFVIAEGGNPVTATQVQKDIQKQGYVIDQRLCGLILAEIACTCMDGIEARSEGVHAADMMYEHIYSGKVALLKMSVLDHVSFAPQICHVKGAFEGKAATLLSELTHTSNEAVMDTIDGASGREVRNIVQSWMTQFRDVHSSETQQLLALSVPCGHALLLTSGLWREYALPCLPIHQRLNTCVQGLRLLPKVCSVAPQPRETNWQEENDLGSLSAFGFEAAEFIRQQTLLLSQHGVEAHISEGCRWAIWADKLKLCSVSAGPGIGDSARLNRLQQMIAIVAFAGLLAEPNEFQMGLQLALSLALPPQLLQPCNHVLQEHMRTQHTSRTTCWRHRLTIYFALQLLKGDHFLSAPTVRYEILDSSPQGGFDYLMRLTTSIEVQYLARAYEVSVALCTPRALQHADHDEDALLREIQTLVIVKQFAIKLLLVLVWLWNRCFNIAHKGALTTLGSGRCGVAHKLAALTHSWRLELPDWNSCSVAACRTQSITSDFGVESRLAGVSVPLGQLHPWLREFDCQDPSSMHMEATVGEETSVNLTAALGIPGALHILHNATADVLNHLEHAQAWLKDVRIISRLLTKRWLKSRSVCHLLPRFLATCFKDTDGWTKHRQVLLKFRHHVHTGRWGSVAAAVRSLLHCKTALQHGWNTNAFNFGKGKQAKQLKPAISERSRYKHLRF